MARLRRSLALLLALSAAMGVSALTAHCSLTTSPTDYTSGLNTPPDAGPPSRVVVVAGERDRLEPSEFENVAASDVWTASITADGSIRGWSVGPSAPFTRNARKTLIHDGLLYVVGAQRFEDPQVGVEWIPLTAEGVGPAWKGAYAEIPRFRNQGLLFLPAGVVTFGGSLTGFSDFVSDVSFSAFDEETKTFAARQSVPAKLTVPRSDVVMVVYENFIYAMGGMAQDEVTTSTVDLATLTDTGLKSIVQTTAMQNPDAQQPYKARDFAACTGRGTLYVIGGTLSDGPSDWALMSRIDGSNGQLSPWQSLTKLPGARAGAGCIVARNRLYVFGGKGATGRSAEVLSAPILPDGALGAWDASAHAPLPAPRSQIAVAAF